MTYPDDALGPHNNGVIEQLHHRSASKHCHPVLGELQSDNHGLIHSCNNMQIHDSHLRKW